MSVAEMESALSIEVKILDLALATHSRTAGSSPQYLSPNSSSRNVRLLHVIVLLKEKIKAEKGMHLEDWEGGRETRLLQAKHTLATSSLNPARTICSKSR
jgi:hypothetical protein